MMVAISKGIEAFIQSCPACLKCSSPSREPLVPTELPGKELLLIFLTSNNPHTYILVIGYFSRFIAVKKLISTTAASVIQVLKEMFARFGIPATVVSDNGPQYSCLEMKELA